MQKTTQTATANLCRRAALRAAETTASGPSCTPTDAASGKWVTDWEGSGAIRVVL